MFLLTMDTLMTISRHENGNFRYLGIVGHGTFGIVYKYSDLNGRNICCVKLMEYMQRGSLAKLILHQLDKNEFFHEQEIKSFLLDMMMGIKFLHMKNVIHKDLKPDNILVATDLRLKIADFGVAHIADIEYGDDGSSNNCQHHQGPSIGTPMYMAPETSLHKLFSCASDIWALGCILYELCILKPAFDSPWTI